MHAAKTGELTSLLLCILIIKVLLEIKKCKYILKKFFIFYSHIKTHDYMEVS